MKRMEIIFSQSIEEDLFGALKTIPEAQHFSLIPGVRGKGFSTPKMGDPVWPEINELLIIYCEDDAVERINDAVQTVRSRYPTEGLAIFVM